ncbi:uncharacterized protein LOC118185414 [Stegodyphus dumicola]|uniref:uncharacterized protein LOC118185414 n=1 Tax=Stegodyphus dumicola TaxID=202533 RepID=UPI0015B04213|nr:uncharacterized protein LOC118185414 [Stegodyphus dumicola]
MLWNKELDTLKINMGWLNDFNLEKITKRSMLSAVHKVFDPFGFFSPVMLCPKIMLQKGWKKSVSWDEKLTGELRKDFLQWLEELKCLSEIEIPRFIQVTSENLSSCALHTFVDGSKDAYTAVTFLRIENNDRVELFLLAAKSRVAPLRGATIPRMELLAAVIGARLTDSVTKALGWERVNKYYWSDSTTVLAWIKRDENWSVFVRNRVKEIRELSKPSAWKHVPGERNPADLPSRGCKAKYVITSRWWEGPHWMKDPTEFLNYMDSCNHHSCNEEEIQREKLKTTSTMTNNETVCDNNWYYGHFSNYERIVRMVTWILRFKHNCTNTESRRYGELNTTEFRDAELKILRMIQKESLDLEHDRLKTLQVFKDDRGIYRVKTKIIYRKDSEDFLKPVVFLQTTKL